MLLTSNPSTVLKPEPKSSPNLKPDHTNTYIITNSKYINEQKDIERIFHTMLTEKIKGKKKETRGRSGWRD